MQVPFLKEMRIGAYILKQKLAGRKRYPLVLMLEPLFRCNLACVGCGKIDYPDADPQSPALGQGMPRRRRRVRRAHGGDPGRRAAHSPRDRRDRQRHRGQEEIRLALHQCAAAREEAALCSSPRPICSSRSISTGSRIITTNRSARRACSIARSRRSRPPRPRASPSTSTPRSSTAIPRQDIAAFLDLAKELGVGVSISPGYAYERAPDQEHFLSRRKTKELFRDVFARGKGKNWTFVHSGLFLDFLAGNQTYHCTPWGMPTRNIFGWQKPCYLLGRRLRQDLRRADGDHRLGFLRHRPLREMRELHGALRLRADRRGGHLRQPAARRSRSRCSACAPKGRWRRKSRSRTSARRSSCSRATSSRSLPPSMQAAKRPATPMEAAE